MGAVAAAGAAFGGLDVEAARRLEVPVVVVTLGHRGAVVITTRDVVEVGVRPVLGLADTVGAGDAFLALMAAARTHGAGVIEATRLACVGAADMLRGRLRVESRADDPALRVHRTGTAVADSRGARTRGRQR
jgi:sugar/nucleoside kinase (ribokinase family)